MTLKLVLLLLRTLASEYLMDFLLLFLVFAGKNEELLMGVITQTITTINGRLIECFMFYKGDIYEYFENGVHFFIRKYFFLQKSFLKTF